MSKQNDLLNTTMERAKELSNEELEDFALKMNMATLALLRGMHGDEFMRGYFIAAQNDKKPLTITPSGLNKH